MSKIATLDEAYNILCALEARLRSADCFAEHDGELELLDRVRQAIAFRVTGLSFTTAKPEHGTVER